MPPAVFAREEHRDAARTLVGILTLGPDGPAGYDRAALDLLPPRLSRHEVAAGAAILLDRLIGEVAATLRLDRAETVVRLGTWIAADEFVEGPNG